MGEAHTKNKPKSLNRAALRAGGELGGMVRWAVKTKLPGSEGAILKQRPALSLSNPAWA
jgi:hypothetical protein